MKAEHGKGRDGHTLTLSGSLTLPHAGRLKEALLNALSGTEELIIAFDIIDDVDLSFLQLICSAEMLASCNGKKLTFASRDNPPMIEALAKLAGFKGLACVESREAVHE